MALKQLIEKRNKLAAKQKKLTSIFAEGKDGKDIDIKKIKSLSGTTEEKLGEIRKMNEELDSLGKEVEALVIFEKSLKNVKSETSERFPHEEEEKKESKGFGDLFVEMAEYKANGWQRGSRISGQIKNGLFLLLKATFITSAGWAPQSIRTGRVVEEALRPIQVIDTIPSGRTTQAAIVYMEETTVTNASAERAEGAAYPEGALELTEQTSLVRSIGISLPVTDEQLSDVEQVRSYLNMRLPFLVKQRLDSQILVGDGTPPDLRGINNLAGILTQAKGSDPGPDAIYKGMRAIRVTGRANPNIVYAHPNDWQAIRLLRTSDGVYIWGNPSEAGPMKIWGIMVVETDAQTENTVLVSDTSFMQLYTREDVSVEVGYVNDDFTDGRVTFRAGVRVALAAYRPAASCQVTGM